MFRLAPAVLVVLGVLGGYLPAKAGEQKIVLREYLGRQWDRELLTYPVRFAAGECAASTISLALRGGPAPVPAQLLEVELWPGTEFVKAAKLAFVADLSPLEVKEYTFTYAPAATAAVPPTPSDLVVKPGAGVVELTTSGFGLRMLLGEKTYDPPAAAAEVPGPVAALRTATGEWYGGSRLYGPGRIEGYAARLVDRGPAVGGVEVTYRYEGGRTMALRVRLAEGNKQALWELKGEPYDRELAVQLVQGVGWNEAEKAAEESAVKDGWELLVSPGVPALQMLVPHSVFNARWQLPNPPGAKLGTLWVEVPLDQEPAGQLLSLEPWAGWWEQIHQTQLRFQDPTWGQFLQLRTVDPGDWVEAAPLGTWASYGNLRMRHKWCPLVKGADGEVYVQFSACSGLRRWRGGVPTEPITDQAFTRPDQTLKYTEAKADPWPLDRVKDLVLNWPEDVGTHPRIFFSRADLEERRRQEPATAEFVNAAREYARVYQFIEVPSYRDPLPLTAYLATGSTELAEEFRLRDRLAQYLGMLGNLDRMRTAGQIASMYDALADSGLLTPEERAVRQAQLAYLAYLCADAENWSMERGYASGNLNMSSMHVINQGMMAAAIPEHPLAQEWSQAPLFMVEKWLTENVAPTGEWVAPGESIANYAEVSVMPLVVYAAVATRAGIRDLFSDPRLKKLMLYLAKQYAPPDPRPFDKRTEPVAVTPPVGRGPAYHAVTGIFGPMAKGTAESDPTFSQQMQWLWLRGGQSTGYVDDKMGGLERFAMDPSLPAATPPWGSERFPAIGAILRHGVGTPEEFYLNFVMDNSNRMVYASENGGIAALWAKGAPTTVRFAGKGYAEREEIFINRVSLARDQWDLDFRKAHFMYEGPAAVTDFAALPRQDYLAATLRLDRTKPYWHNDLDNTDVIPQWATMARAGTPPLDWKRQVLLVKGAEAAEPTYLLFRDTVSGGQPTAWQFWTLSEKIGTPEEVRDLQAFLADKPGDKLVDAREIHGDRFTAVGQQGVDVEYYIAAPTDTPRQTLRWGQAYYHYYTEYQDLLHLQRTGDGAYFVAYYPRRREEAVPTFATLGEGKVIKVSGAWGTDYGYLSDVEATAEAEEASFEGTVASVQDRGNGLVLSLGGAGTVRYGDKLVACEQPVSVRVLPDLALVDLAADHPGTQVRLRLPGAWQLYRPEAGVKLQRADGDSLLSVPAGASQVRLVKG